MSAGDCYKGWSHLPPESTEPALHALPVALVSSYTISQPGVAFLPEGRHEFKRPVFLPLPGGTDDSSLISVIFSEGASSRFPRPRS